MRHSNTTTFSQKNLRKKQLPLAITQVLLLGATTAHAATITVDSKLDPGGAVTNSSICTLRDAIQAANTNAPVDTCSAGSISASDNIVFASSLTTSPTIITLGGSALSISTDMSIDGKSNITINAAGASQVMDVSGGKLTLSGLTLTGGHTTNIGGGLYAHTGASVILSNCTISGNSADQGAGGLVAYRGSTTISLINSTVSGNTSSTAGGIGALGGVLNLTNSTVSGNTAMGGQIGGGGVLAYYHSTVSLTNSTVSGNSTDKNGGGILVSDKDPNNSYAFASSTVSLSNSTVSGNTATGFGGGILTVDSNISLTNSTVSGNTANTSGGGVLNYGIKSSGGSVSLINSTVSGNSGGKYGGVIAGGAYAKLSLTNSILANSTGGGMDCYMGGGGSVTADAYNIIADGSCSTSAQAVDPMLGPLADNGGPTLTHLPQTGSPAINGGDQAACTSDKITTDQRGYSRSDGSCDIGSVEVGAKPPPNSGGGGGGGASGPLMLLFAGLLWPLRRWRRRG